MVFLNIIHGRCVYRKWAPLTLPVCGAAYLPIYHGAYRRCICSTTALYLQPWTGQSSWTAKFPSSFIGA